MRTRIPSSYTKRIDQLERERKIQTLRPVAMFPRLVSVDEWGELASQMQGILKDNIKLDTPPDYGRLPKLEVVASR
ncbi:hypothetical protein [Aliiglaciecola sp. LCG003]|uniref:hypothetical protein n=1 Tax=Aliiglaciecola sp. LCG003 TaxID=3053655 RepID=UPI002573B82A|nr:hypothetical protein [Aliiglaciecola sp. LCG003]WJG10366.1 hypothetical protein QR722_04830 [Aliiglaciecola sp. LCG003]